MSPNRTVLVCALVFLAHAAQVQAQERVTLPDGTPATQVIEAQQKAPRGDVQSAPRVPGSNLSRAPADALPPPGLDESRQGETVGLKEAGAVPVEKVLPTERAPEASPRTQPIKSGEPLPAKVRPTEDLAPQVTIRRSENMTVEEYRRNGQVYMVIFTPKNGLRYSFIDTDGDGRLEGDPSVGGVQPVYYTIYEWD